MQDRLQLQHTLTVSVSETSFDNVNRKSDLNVLNHRAYTLLVTDVEGGDNEKKKSRLSSISDLSSVEDDESVPEFKLPPRNSSPMN